MKTFNDLTNSEILKLENKQIKNFIKLAYADAGIKLIQKPVEPKYEEEAEPDKTLYMVKGVNVCFEKKEVAEEVAKVLRNNFSSLKKKDYDYEYSSDKKYEKSLSNDYEYRNGVNDIQVSEVIVYSQELYNLVADVFQRNKKLKDDYEAQKKEYDEWFENSKNIRDDIWDKVNEIKDEQAEKERMLERFNEYYQLAEKNEKIAWTFLEKAYSLNQEQRDYIKANFKIIKN